MLQQLHWKLPSLWILIKDVGKVLYLSRCYIECCDSEVVTTSNSQVLSAVWASKHTFHQSSWPGQEDVAVKTFNNQYGMGTDNKNRHQPQTVGTVRVRGPSNTSALVYGSGQSHFPLPATGYQSCEYYHLTGVGNSSIQDLSYIVAALFILIQQVPLSVSQESPSTSQLLKQYAILIPKSQGISMFSVSKKEEIIVLLSAVTPTKTWINLPSLLNYSESLYHCISYILVLNARYIDEYYFKS